VAVNKQSGLWIQRDHTLHIESVLLADGVKGRVLISDIRSRLRRALVYDARDALTKTMTLNFPVLSDGKHGKN
jgi:hypothetical protein